MKTKVMKKVRIALLSMLYATAIGGGVTSCDYWNEDWYKNGTDPTQSSSSSDDINLDFGWWGSLGINTYNGSTVWPHDSSSPTVTLTGNATYTLNADISWMFFSANASNELKKQKSDQCIAGATIQWSLEENQNDIATLTPSADTLSCTVTIDYSKLPATGKSMVKIKAFLASDADEKQYIGNGSYDPDPILHTAIVGTEFKK